MPGSHFRRVLCQLPGREQVISYQETFQQLCCLHLLWESLIVPQWVFSGSNWLSPPASICPFGIPLIQWNNDFCISILHWFEELKFFHLPSSSLFVFSWIIFNLHQLPDLVHCGTVWTAEWAQWECWEQGDGERKERKDRGRTTEASTFAKTSVSLCF